MTAGVETARRGPDATTGADPVLEARGVTFRYPGAERPAVEGVDLAVEAGTLHAVLGPNGSGKSTLLRLLLGALEPGKGRVLHEGLPLASRSRREVARRVGVVPQREPTAFPMTVRELVAMGRYPHLGSWRREGPEDRRAVEEALARCDLEALRDRPLDTLSGGERQLARVARALAQRPRALVLDEPTVSLDLRHRMRIYGLLRRLVHREGVTVLLVTHDLDAAARFAGRILLLDGGRAAAAGSPREVLVREVLEAVYGWPVRVLPHPGPGPDRGAPLVVPLVEPESDAGPEHAEAPPDIAPGPADSDHDHDEGGDAP